jgi:hypothetical protein
MAFYVSVIYLTSQLCKHFRPKLSHYYIITYVSFVLVILRPPNLFKIQLSLHYAEHIAVISTWELLDLFWPNFEIMAFTSALLVLCCSMCEWKFRFSNRVNTLELLCIAIFGNIYFLLSIKRVHMTTLLESFGHIGRHAAICSGKMLMNHWSF